MTRDDIIKLAQQCDLIGLRPHLDGIYQEALERFAGLVVAAERNKEEQENGKYFCPVCNRQEMVRAKFDEESG